MSHSPSSPFRQGMQSASQAQHLLSEAENVLLRLTALLDEETELAKSGRLGRASALQTEKEQLTAAYIRTAELYRFNLPYLNTHHAAGTQKLGTLHAVFQKCIARNARVLATATALTEGLIQEVMEAINTHHRPSGYGANGAASTPYAQHATPLKINCSL